MKSVWIAVLLFGLIGAVVVTTAVLPGHQDRNVPGATTGVGKRSLSD
jgi:hypothetical protein